MKPPSTDPSIVLFERALSAGAQLLRIERLAAAGEPDAASALVLTFDVGRILVRADPTRQCVVAEHLPSSGEALAGLASADEEEPWWRVLGAVLSRATPVPDSAGIRLQFRPDSDNPRRIDLLHETGRLHVRLTT